MFPKQWRVENNEPNHEAWRPPTVRNFWGKRMHVTRSSHRKARLAWNLSHGNGNAFRVHKKIRQTVATGWSQPITTTRSQNGQIIIYSAFFGIIDRTSYTGQNYRTNTIIIVHLATLMPTVLFQSARFTIDLLTQSQKHLVPKLKQTGEWDKK